MQLVRNLDAAEMFCVYSVEKLEAEMEMKVYISGFLWSSVAMGLSCTGGKEALSLLPLK